MDYEQTKTGQKMNKEYKRLFDNESDKAKAFDKIAENFYYGNFGTMSKTDFEILMFSIYIERILDKSQDDMYTYSDYTLSKQLGITQSRVSNLKVKKELKYPYPKFDWKKAFYGVCKNARYENGKILLNIPDKNLYLEIKNAIEMSGGYIDVQLNSNLLKVRPEYFIDLMLAATGEDNRDKICNKIKEIIKDKDKDINILEKQSIGDILKNSSYKVISTVVSLAIKEFVPIIGTSLANYLSTLLS